MLAKSFSRQRICYQAADLQTVLAVPTSCRQQPDGSPALAALAYFAAVLEREEHDFPVADWAELLFVLAPEDYGEPPTAGANDALAWERGQAGGDDRPDRSRAVAVSSG